MRSLLQSWQAGSRAKKQARAQARRVKLRFDRLAHETLEDRRVLAAGDLDTTFGGGDGIVTTNLSGTDNVYDLAIVPGGKILAVGIGAGQPMAAARYLSDGTLDATFGTAGSSTSAAVQSEAMIALSDGSFLVAGANPLPDFSTGFNMTVVKFTAGGAVDTTFGTSGVATVDFGTFDDKALDIALQSDGKIILAGYSISGSSVISLARLTAGGVLDTTFGVSGKATLDIPGGAEQAQAVVIDSSDGILVAGLQDNDAVVARFTAGGVLDTSFNGTGYNVTDFGAAVGRFDDLALDSSGRVVAAGTYNQDFALARYTTGGVLDATFDNDGRVTTDFGGSESGRALVIQPLGHIVVAGSSGSDFALARYVSNGSLDAEFSVDGLVTTNVGGSEVAFSIVNVTDKVLVGGSGASATDFVLAQYLAPENTPPTAEAGGPYSVAEGGSVVLSGAASSDLDQPTNTLTFEWDLDNNGSYETSGMTPTFSAALLDGPASVTVGLRVTDNGGLTSLDTATVNISNVTPTVTAAADQSTTEGTSTSISLGSFADVSIDSPWTVTVNWGDGSTDDMFNAGSQGSLGSLNHTYADNGSYTVTVSVKDNDNSTGSDTLDVTVGNATPTVVAGADTSATEGTSVSVALGSFSDLGTADNPWVVTVDWGDGSTDDVFNAGSQGSLGSLNHTYADNGSYTVTVSVQDKDSSTGSDTLDITVGNAAPAVNAGADTSTTEGTSVSVALGSFSDLGLADGPWAVTASWGDGSADDMFNAGSQGSLGSLNHTYADNGSYTVTVSVKDKDNSTGSDTLDVTVGNAAPVVTAGMDTSGIEGTAISVALGSFSDLGTTDNPWVVTVSWGDGSSDDVFNAGSQGSLGSLNHTYADNGSYTVTVSVKDKDNSTGSDTLDITVGNAAPAVAAGADTSTTEGTSVSVDLGSFSDLGTADNPWVVTVDWGDGSTDDVFNAGSQGSLGSLNHAYADNGTYTVTVNVEDKDGSTGSDTLDITVSNAAPAVNAGADASVSEGTSVSIALGSFSDLGTADGPWAVTVNWGDGSSDNLFNAGSQGSLGSLNHTYADNGTYTVTVSVQDKDGSTGSDTLDVTVANENPVVGPINGPTAGIRGETLTFTGSFTDPGADTWTGTVDFGDGSPVQPLTIGPGQTFSASHGFWANGNYTVTITVNDDDGGSGFNTIVTSINVFAVRPDPWNPTKMALFAGGTSGNDIIRTYKPAGQTLVFLDVNGMITSFTTPLNKPFGRAYLYGGDGNDNIRVGGGTATAAVLYGGMGNDSLAGTSGADYLFGEGGNDRLTGGGGNDIVIGGTGMDRVQGNAGEDIMIDGTTSYDYDFAALCAMITEWGDKTKTFAQRQANLINGSGTPTRHNGSYFLVENTTVQHDLDADTLIFGAGTDLNWLIYDLSRDVAKAK